MGILHVLVSSVLTVIITHFFSMSHMARIDGRTSILGEEHYRFDFILKNIGLASSARHFLAI